MTKGKATPAPEQTLRLSELRGLAHRIAAAELRQHGRYLCMVDGVRTEVLPDEPEAEA